jgi:hypothetical protein
MERRRGAAYALSPDRPRALEAPSRRVRQNTAGDAPLVTSIIVLVFAILLCLVNAVVWTFVSEMPFMGLVWLLAAVSCLRLQKWSRG